MVTKIFTKDIEYQNESLSLSKMNKNAARSQVKTSSLPRNSVQTSSTERTETLCLLQAKGLTELSSKLLERLCPVSASTT